MRTLLAAILLVASPVAGAQDLSFHESIDLTGDEPRVGATDAGYTILQVSDWLCPHCGTMFTDLGAVVAEQPDVAMIFKVYPLTTECNPSIGSSTHLARCTLAQAASCAHQQGKWPEFAAYAFKNMNDLGEVTADSIGEHAKPIGLKTGKFTKCVAGELGGQQVLADAMEGGRLNISGTPTVFVQGPDKGGWYEVAGADGAAAKIAELREME